MAKQRLYCCPIDVDQVLYSVDINEDKSNTMAEFGLFHIPVPERPETCPKCGKSYLKWECITKEK